jgi:hypothetical protein
MESAYCCIKSNCGESDTESEFYTSGRYDPTYLETDIEFACVKMRFPRQSGPALRKSIFISNLSSPLPVL